MVEAAAKRRVKSATAATESVFDTAQPKPTNGPQPTMGRFQNIVERTFDLGNVDELYAGLIDELHIGAALTPGNLEHARNNAERNALDAHRLYVGAKVAHEVFEIEAEAVAGALRTAATAELQKEKDAKQRSKAITEADVREKCAAMFPDEWLAISERRAKAEGALSSMKRLADLWEARCFGLSTMLSAGKQR